MIIQRKIGILAAVAAAVLMTAGCASIAKLRNIQVTSLNVKSFHPINGKTVEGVLLVGIDNPGASFTATDLSGAVKYKDRVMGYFTGDGPVEVRGNAAGEYEVEGQVELAEGVTLIDVMTAASKGSMEDVAVDLSLQVQVRKISKKLHFNDLKF